MASPGRRVAVVAAMLLSIAGCGTSGYEQLIEDNMAPMRVAASFSSLAERAVPIPGTPASVRLPKFVNQDAKAYNERSPEPSGQGPVQAARLNPPFLKLPGQRVCYEMQGLDPSTNQQLPYYCYLAAQPASEPGPDGKPFEAWVQEQLAATFADSNPTWGDVSCQSPDAGLVMWRMISAKGPQPFVNLGGTPQPFAGTFLLYAREVDGWRVLIGWRFPDGVGRQQNIDAVAPAVAGTVTVAGAAPAGEAAGEAAASE